MSDPDADSTPPVDNGDAHRRLAASAHGWHRIQLAVLGFLGLCGVLWGGGGAAAPRELQWVAAALVAVAFLLACAAILVVGQVAFQTEAPAAPTSSVTLAGRLRIGIRMTYLAVAVLAVATLSAWWPSASASGAVEVHDVRGQAWCGTLVDSPDGTIGLATDEGTVRLPLQAVTSVGPATAC